MAQARRIIIPSSLLCLLFYTVTSSDLPYNPTRVFLSPINDAVYLLDPPTSSASQGSLRKLESSKSISLQDLPFHTVSSSLPFLKDNPSATYTTTIDGHGNIYVFAGSCSAPASTAEVWQFTPGRGAKSLDGSWSRHSVNADVGSSEVGPNYLSSAIAFSPSTTSNATVYNFGGMCPTGSSDAQDWISQAKYSQDVIMLEPDTSSEYDFQLGTSRGQPIAEAGFSMTPLQPTFSDTDGGTQKVQQQDFLLLGGHTQQAFINMSQVALFSLPQTSWSFLSIDPSIPPSTSQPSHVEPRSGHTALLTSDGSKVIVFGGWVGDIASAAEPQLAVLEVGMGYGGSRSWTWLQSPVPQPPDMQGTGIYGHGAVMLPGDIMLVSGGYTIPHPSNDKAKRASPPSSDQTLLFNITSNSWVQSYKPPPQPKTSLAAHDHSSSGLLSTKPQKVGLGVGLTLGVVALAIAALIGWLFAHRYKRRYKREQETREKELVNSTLRGSNPFGMTGFSERNSGVYAGNYWHGKRQPSDNQHQGIWKDTGVREAERTGMDLDIPSPHRGLRKSMQARSRLDESRWSHGSGAIHPIEEEGDEDEIRPASALDDPFRDPDVQSPAGPYINSKTIRRTPDHVERPTSPISSAEQHNVDLQGWVDDWIRSNSTSHSHSAQTTASAGRISPDRSERTRSDLSEVSAFSHTSDVATSNTYHRNEVIVSPLNDSFVPPGRRDTKPRSPLRVFPPTTRPFSSSAPPSPSQNSTGNSPTRAFPPHSAGADSFQTARSNLADLQAESEALLGPQAHGQSAFFHSPVSPQQPGPKESDPDAEPFNFTRRTGAPPRHAPTSKVGSWVGSVRRAINTASRSASLTNSSNNARAAAVAAGGSRDTGALGGFVTEPGSAASSPTKDRPRGGNKAGLYGVNDGSCRDGPAGRLSVRRSASDGASQFLATAAAKRSDADWHTDARRDPRAQSLVSAQRPAWAGRDDDWDVEAAARDRDVQVMYSVPRERLRVVNPDVEGGSVRSRESGGGD